MLSPSPLSTSPIAPNSRRIDRYKTRNRSLKCKYRQVKCVFATFACGFCGSARVMWSGISFLLDAWFLRLLGEGQFRILPLRGRPEKQGSLPESGSSQSGRASHLVSQGFTVFALLVTGWIPTASSSSAINSSISKSSSESSSQWGRRDSPSAAVCFVPFTWRTSKSNSLIHAS